MGDRSEPGTPPAGLALCLAGGGFPGALFEFGAVAALDAALEGWQPATSSIVVGTSCGALVGALLGMGVTSAEVKEALNGDDPHWLSFSRRDFSRVPWTHHLQRFLSRTERRESRQPVGVFSNSGIEDLLHRVRQQKSMSDTFDELQPLLAITATSLDTGEREVFGRRWSGAGVTEAVRASTAIPGYFEPVRVNGTDFIDGQIVDPMHLDLTAGHGTRAVFAVSPLTTYRGGQEPGVVRIRDLGVSGVMDQSARISATVKARGTWERFQRTHPDIRCVFVTPEPSEVVTLIRAGFDKKSLVLSWELGYRSAERVLDRESKRIAEFLKPLGISLNS